VLVRLLSLAYTSSVARQTYLRLGAAVLLASLIPPCPPLANSQECKTGSVDTAQETKVNISSVEFRVGDVVPAEIRTQLRRNVEEHEFSVEPGMPDTDWVNELNEVVVRDVLASAGYFPAQTHTTPYLVRAESHHRLYAVRIEVETGPQYRLGKVQFADVTAFTQDDLPEHVRLVTGEIFDVAKVREAIESIERLYSAKGYIDATIEPQMKIDDEKQQIDLVMKLSEGVQYRVRTVEILGIEGKSKSRLVVLLEPGHVFDASVLRQFLKQNVSTLPAGVSVERNVTINRDTRDRTVDIVLDVRSKGCTESAAHTF
jgi:outer membrane translocation and assembly module TamA